MKNINNKKKTGVVYKCMGCGNIISITGSKYLDLSGITARIEEILDMEDTILTSNIINMVMGNKREKEKCCKVCYYNIEIQE